MPAAIVLFAYMATFAAGGEKTVNFSGCEWTIRGPEESGGPGPNRWDDRNAWLDGAGNLHLRITRRAGKWYCGEVYTTKKFGFGVYQFVVEGSVDRIDRNVVFGLFNYPESDLGPDGTHEMDIEFAKWGKSSGNIGNYTVYPAMAGLEQETTNFAFTLRADGISTQRFTWMRSSVLFQSFHGQSDDNSNLFHSWLYQPKDFTKHISQGTMPVHINLWCFKGKGPTDGKEVEVVIKAFKFTPKPE